MTSDIQNVLDAAANLTESYIEEIQTVAAVPLGAMQDLQNMVDAWRAGGGKTSEEMAEESS